LIMEAAEKLAHILGFETLVGGHSREGVERESVTIISSCNC